MKISSVLSERRRKFHRAEKKKKKKGIQGRPWHRVGEEISLRPGLSLSGIQKSAEWRADTQTDRTRKVQTARERDEEMWMPWQQESASVNHLFGSRFGRHATYNTIDDNSVQFLTVHHPPHSCNHHHFHPHSLYHPTRPCSPHSRCLLYIPVRAVNRLQSFM